MKTTIPLDADSTDRVLANAIQNHSQMVLQVPGESQATLNGFLITADEATLLMEVTGKPAIAPSALAGTTVEGELFSDQRYCFTATVRSAPNWGDSQALALERPREIKVLDRRRFWRARLAPSARVTLEWMHCGSRERHEASLLNVSSDGLACRMDKLAASAVELQSTVIAQFQIHGNSQGFKLEGVVMNKTPASGGGFIVGLQFSRVLDSVGQLAELRKLLSASSPSLTSEKSEVLA